MSHPLTQDFIRDMADFYSGRHIFRSIPGFSDYLIDQFGRVLSIRRGYPRLLRAGENHGYSVYVLYDAKGRRHTFSAQRLVLLAHVGPAPSPRHDAAHQNGHRWDNRPTNLRWLTRAENLADRTRHGTTGRKSHHATIVTEAMVRDILASDDHTIDLADRHQITAGMVRSIRRGSTYLHFASDVPRRNKST